MFDPVTAGIALSLAGGLAGGLLGKQKVPEFKEAERISEFKGPLGTATERGFDFAGDPNRAAAIGTGNEQLAQLLSRGFEINPQRLQEFQSAFLAERRPELERQLGEQAQAQAIRSSTAGTGGGSADILRSALQGEGANRARSELLNQAIQGREGLAQQDLQQRLAQGSFLNTLGRGDIQDRLSALSATTGARTGSQRSEIDLINSINLARGSQASAENLATQTELSNIFGGATAGANLGLGIFG